MTIHAHVSTESADCDGRYSRSYVRMPADDEVGDYEFRVDTIGHALAYAGDSATVNFTEFGFTVSEPTDEGYTFSEFVWCEDDDTDEPNTYRDHSAEAAGY